MPHIHDKIDFTAEVFVVHNNKVLLRKHDKYGFWLSVGGHIELDEDSNETAIREVKEEVGLDVELYHEEKYPLSSKENYKELIPPQFMNRHRINDSHEHVTLIYFAKTNTDKLILSETEKSDECKWFTKEDLNNPEYEIRDNIKMYSLKALEKLGIIGDKMIIGITGTLGAGKGTIVEHLKTLGFKHFSVSEFLKDRLIDKNLEINRDNMVLIANELRKENYPSYIVEKLYSLAKEEKGNCIIESIRNIGEIEGLKDKGNFYLVSVDADINLRYQRISKRGSEKDKISFEKFAQDEKREMESEELHKINLKECILRSDFKLTNNWSIEELEKKVDRILNVIGTDF